YLRGDDLIQAYRAADAFIFPSTTETFGLVALEAMACGLPVIAVKAGGIVDSVTHGKTGLFYEQGRFEQVGPLIDKLHHDPDYRNELAQKGWEHAQNRSWRATMDQLLNFYYETIAISARKR
ncbi:MAG: glycosyltransferase, partial [Chloroflexota bacterium]